MMAMSGTGRRKSGPSAAILSGEGEVDKARLHPEGRPGEGEREGGGGL